MRTRMVAGLIAAIAVAGSGSARAQVSIFTPPLSAGTNYQTIVCRATNTDTVGQFVTLNLRSADNGQGGTPTVLPLLPGETGEISFIGFSNAYCEITANTATIADKIVTGIYVLDFSNGGVSTGGLPGARILPGGGTAQRTSSVEATNAQALGCQAVNVGGRFWMTRTESSPVRRRRSHRWPGSWFPRRPDQSSDVARRRPARPVWPRIFGSACSQRTRGYSSLRAHRSRARCGRSCRVSGPGGTCRALSSFRVASDSQRGAFGTPAHRDARVP